MKTGSPVFSVIIPAFNEATIIGETIGKVRAAAKGHRVEIIVADGGSRDQTEKIASNSGARVISTTRGRGYQLNAGAHAAKGDIFLFLHADTYLPPEAFDILAEKFSKEAVQVGTFRLTFDINHWILKWYTFCRRFDSVLTRFGDHCLAVRRGFFYRIAEYPTWPLFEEIYFLQKSRTLTKVHLFDAEVITSGRRFLRNGIVRQYFFDAVMMARYLLGTSPYTLAAEYDRRNRKKHTALIIFAQYPAAGKVKTRRARGTGPAYAASFYRSTAKRILRAIENVRTPDVATYLFGADGADIANMRRWAGRHFHYFPQDGRDLGKKMAQAFKIAFRHGAQDAVILGTDIPDLSEGFIARAREELKNHDAVIGPSIDGGYYLLGMKEFHRELFTGIPWSTPDVYARTLTLMRRLNLQVAILPALRDIDTREDLELWQSGPSDTSNDTGERAVFFH